MKAFAVFLFAAALSAQTVKPALTENQKADVSFNSSIAYCQKNPGGTAWLYSSTITHDWFSMPCPKFLRLAKPTIDIRAVFDKSRQLRTVKHALPPEQNINRGTFNARPDEYMVIPAHPMVIPTHPIYGTQFPVTQYITPISHDSMATLYSPKDDSFECQMPDENTLKDCKLKNGHTLTEALQVLYAEVKQRDEQLKKERTQMIDLLTYLQRLLDPKERAK